MRQGEISEPGFVAVVNILAAEMLMFLCITSICFNPVKFRCAIYKYEYV